MTVTVEQLSRLPNIEDLAAGPDGTYRVADEEPAVEKGSAGEEKAKQKSQADLLVEIALDRGAAFFHTSTDEVFVSLRSDDHVEHWPVHSTAARRWLRHGYFLKTGKAPNGEAMQNALCVLESVAAFDGALADIHLRTAWHNGALFYDLCDAGWRVVMIDADGWRVVEQPEVRFLRHTHMAPQIEPQRGGDIDLVFDFVNLKDRHHRELISKFLPVALVPDIPRPCVVLHGDQGSGKTTTARRLRDLIDPSCVSTVRCRDDSELVQALSHHFFPIIDNLSAIPTWLSDLLARAVTGEGFTKRKLYSDADDVLFSFRRTFILTGIGQVATKPDLLDRCILIELERISDDKRLDERQLNEKFQTARPFILGAIFDSLSGAIRQYHNVKPARLPRMADFVKWGSAVAIGQGRGQAEFINAFNENVSRQSDEALASSTVATVLLAFLDSNSDSNVSSVSTVGSFKKFSGTPHELFTALKEKADTMKLPARSFPGSAASLGRKLREVRPNLSSLGIEIKFLDTARPRQIEISTRIPSETAETGDGADGADGTWEELP